MTTERAIAIGAALSALGIVLAALGHATLGGVVVLAGWLALVGAVHRFGRGR